MEQMAQTNDNKIMSLKQKIADKRQKLDAMPKRVVPITNCYLICDGVTYNLHACSISDLNVLLVKINIYRMSALDLGLDPDNINVSGYSLTEWMDDIRAFIDVRKYKEEKKNLDTLEEQLNGLLSEGKKTELEIEKISALLD